MREMQLVLYVYPEVLEGMNGWGAGRGGVNVL